MLYKDMSETEKRHFKTSICICCMNKFEKTDNVEIIKSKVGRCTMYSYAHVGCIVTRRRIAELYEEGYQNGETY